MSQEDKREKKEQQVPKNANPQRHPGGPSASRKKMERHTRDESDGAEQNTTKQQENSI